LENTKNWFEDEGYTANLTSIEDHIRRIQTQNAVINTRVDRHKRLIRAIANFGRELNRTLAQGESIRVKKPWTDDHYNNNYTIVVNEIANWFNQIKAKQEKLTLIEVKPIFECRPQS
jgi:hypothetical protein